MPKKSLTEEDVRKIVLDEIKTNVVPMFKEMADSFKNQLVTAQDQLLYLIKQIKYSKKG